MNRYLVDTSVWIDFFRNGNSKLDLLLKENLVILHPFILGELVCGNFKNRKEIFSLLNSLPLCKPALHNEVINFVENNTMFGKGIGWIDFHLLISSKINDLELFTLDKKLAATAKKS